MINKNVRSAEVTVCVPCDLYGANARAFCSAAGSFHRTAQIGKCGDVRVCRADSLLGVLSLGVEKGDFIRLTAPARETAGLFDTLKKLQSHISTAPRAG